MRVIEPGHLYSLDSVDGECAQTIRFVKRFRGVENYAGTINQDVLRVLINRVEVLNEEAPWPGNQDILCHLRAALVLHEARALCRKVEKGEIKPEIIETSLKDGHFALRFLP